jgi:hypothetical protein
LNLAGTRGRVPSASHSTNSRNSSLVEFVGSVPREAIDVAAKGALEEFEGARIRALVPVLAWRRARGLLRASRSS